MIRFPRPALALVALVGAVIASGCGGSSGTPTPPPISDPHEVITQAIAHAPAVKSLHIKVEVSGRINVAALTGSSSGGLTNIDLANTTLEGDIDVVKQALDLKFAVPGLLGTTGEFIVVDGYMYTKISVLGDNKFNKSKLSESVPISIPSPGALASGALTAQIDSLRKALDDAGVVATLKSDAKVNGKDAYDISYALPLDKINSMLAQAGGSATAGIKFDSASVEVWVYRENVLPAKIAIKAAAGAVGNLDVTVTLSNYDQAVTIKAPAEGDVKPS